MATLNDSWRGGGTGRGTYTLISRSATAIPLTVQAAAAQTANVFVVENSAGTDLLSVDPSGNLSIAGTATVTVNQAVTGNLTVTGTLAVTNTSTLTGAVTAGSTLTVAGNLRTNAALTVDTNATFGGITSAPAMHLRLRTAAPSLVGSNGILYTLVGDASTTELWYRDAAGNDVQITDAGALEGASLFWDDDEYIRMGNVAATPDVRMGWNTTQTVDAWYFGTADAQNVFLIAENGDRVFDFAHGAQTNPTVFLHSAAQNATQWLSLTHNQTDAVIATGAGDLLITAAGGNFAPSANDGAALGISGQAFADLFLASGAVINFDAGDVTITHAANALTLAGATDVTITQAAATTGASVITLTGGAHTGITAATEDFGVNFNFSATKTWAAGAGPLALQREIIFQAPTYVGNAAGALTVTEAATVAITDAPTQGANMTLSETHALLVMAGSSAFGGNVQPRTTDGAALGTTAIMWSDLFLAAGGVINWGAGDVTLTEAANALTLAGAADVTITQAAATSGAPVITFTGGAHTGITAATEDFGVNFNFSATKTWAAGAGPLALEREIIFQAPTYVGDVGGALTITEAATVAITGAPTQGANMTLSETHALLVMAGSSAFGGNVQPRATDGAALGTTAIMWSDLFLASGAVVNFDNGDVTMTHSANTLAFAGASSGYTFDAEATITRAGVGFDVTNTTDGASVQVAILQGNRATITDGDEAYITLELSDSAGNQDEGARITWKATTVAAGATQDTDLILSALVNNVLTTMLTLDGSASEIVPAVAINSAAAITGTAITGTSFVIGANTLTTSEWAFLDGQNQSVFTTSSPTFVNLTITSFAANWTNAGRTVADLGIITTVDINGGTIDGTSIGATATSTIVGTTIDATTDFTIGGLVVTDGVLTDDSLTLTQSAGTTGATGFTFNIGAHTAITAATERRGINVPAVTKTWAAGAGPLAAQVEVAFLAPTYVGNVGGALTITDSATVYIDAAPVQSTNITLSNTYALWVDGGAVRMDGVVYINDTSNANMTTGLTINQGAATNEIISLKNSNIAHGITGFTETDTYGLITQVGGGEGGISLQGFSETTTGMQFYSAHTTDNATKSTAGLGTISIAAALRTGTTTTVCGADANLVVIRNNATTRFIFDAEGSGHQDVGTAWTEYDEYDDIALLETLNATLLHDPIKGQFRDFLGANKEMLKKNKIVTYNNDGHHFINWSRAHMLTIGAVRQLYAKIEAQAQIIQRLEARLLA